MYCDRGLGTTLTIAQSCAKFYELMLTTLPLQLLIALMKKQHLPYDSAEDGLEALNKFKENPGRYFLVLMDMVGRDTTHPVDSSKLHTLTDHYSRTCQSWTASNPQPRSGNMNASTASGQPTSVL